MERGAGHCSGALFAVFAALHGACGARTPAPIDERPGAEPVATALFIESAEVCGIEAPIEQASELLADDEPGDAAHLVEIAFSDECSGLGGHHLIARTLDGSRFFWLGGHGCQFVPAAIAEAGTWFGVLRASQTAALFQLPAGVCLGFPGESGEISSDSIVRVMALYESREDAEQAALAAE